MISLIHPRDTWLHGWPVGPKLAVLALAGFLLFLTDSLVLHLLAAGATLAIYASCGAAFMRDGMRQLRPLWVFVLLIAVWHLWLGDLAQGARIVLRMGIAVSLANLVTMTSRLDALVDLVTRLARPLRRVGLSPAMLGLAVSLFVRFIPVLTDKGARLAEAWRARSARRPGWRIVFPLSLQALDDADQVAEALRARGGVRAAETWKD